jgi:FtsP/CotA-like multicopper oxidase with cupredoxin domain
MILGRRTLLKAGLAAMLPAERAAAVPLAQPDYSLRIATGLIELSSEHIVSTTLYNGQFPGPLLKLKEGRQVQIDIHNDTDIPELVHWHGQKVPSDIDGAAEEGTPFIPPHGTQRISLLPRPAGLRFYHTHVFAGGDLNRGTYTGLAGPVYIEPRQDPGAYDREVFLVLKEFEPTLSRGGDMAMEVLAGSELPDLKRQGELAEKQARQKTKGFEVGYELFCINGHMLGHGEPLRVKQGERVLLHVLNASATEIRSLALPGHRFRIVALDGNPVPTQAEVPVLWLGTAERISALVRMDHPGVFILGDLADDDRHHGMGMVVEYAGQKGAPRWVKPAPFRWDYTHFGKPPGAEAAAPARTFEITIVKDNGAAEGFNRWMLNGEAFSMQGMKARYTVEEGMRYRLKLRNASDDIHPVHLHRHSFELARIGGKATAGVIKDVVMLGGYQELELDFLADNPGPSLFHCHQQLHMDFGFMALFEYAHARGQTA